MKIIILAGGLGKRLWPLQDPPKQFSHFIGEETLFQKTVRRFLKRYRPEDLVIVTGAPFLHLATAQAMEVDPLMENRIIAENEPKNTAAAILYALDWLKQKGELTETFLAAPSDHLVAPESSFLDTLSMGNSAALAGSHVLFGIFPTHPHTGYGYIVCDPSLPISPVDRFVEKPPKKLAQELLEKGNCLWNMGVFIFHTKSFLSELRLFAPLSIDYALLESAQNLKVIPLQLTWSDVGSWDSVYETFPKDADGNVSSGNVKMSNCKNCLIKGAARPIAAIDLENLLIIESEEGILISKKGSSEQVRLCNFQKPQDAVQPSGST